MKAKLIAIGLALTILAGGAVAGIALDRLWLRPDVTEARRGGRGGDKVDRQLARFRKRLDLDDAQAAAIGDILTRTRQQVRDIRDQSRPAIRAVRDASQSEILALLSADQAAKYRAMIETSNKRRNRRR